MLHAQGTQAATLTALQGLALSQDEALSSAEAKQALGALWLAGADAAVGDFPMVVTCAKLAADAIKRMAGMSLL